MMLLKIVQHCSKCNSCQLNRQQALWRPDASGRIFLKRNFTASLFMFKRNVEETLCADDVSDISDWHSDNYGKDDEGRFVDWIRLKIKAGNGGDGIAHLKRGKSLLGPDGGDGGKGGDIIVIANQSFKHLKLRRGHYKATNGGNGQVDNRRGKDGKSISIKVPIGTIVRDFDTKVIIADLEANGCSCIAAKGGMGGIGNTHFKTATNQAPLDCTPGMEGEEKTIELEMRSIADVGLVGFPNAGKSTLLRALSRAKPAVAAYPFTTLKPNIGVIEYRDYVQVAVADIPGLVEDAHLNKGLGHSFLRHIERCSSLLYVVDLSKGTVLQDFKTLQSEVGLYNESLLNLPSAIIANKVDLVEDHNEVIASIQRKVTCPVIAISGKHVMNIDSLRQLIRDIYERNQLLLAKK